MITKAETKLNYGHKHFMYQNSLEKEFYIVTKQITYDDNLNFV